VDFTVRVTGVQKLARQLGEQPAAFRDAAVEAVEGTIGEVAEKAVDWTADRYNLSKDTLRRHVVVRRASVRADGIRGSVDLHIKAIPLTEFGPQVRMRKLSVHSLTGRLFQRELPTVEVSLYRGRRPRVLPGGFPLRQRNSGHLQAGDSIRRRIGKERGRLTGFRYYTFPRRVTDRLLPELRTLAEGRLTVMLRVAIRKQRKGLRVLAGNE
jgi:hypothetical protein